mmetsp:Transcript_6120/g.8835  ORF Transcript_6120/g.8835 Transcript_6120/m.8835 type:complete len:87 (+) Transcript_6120:322-582(+)
MHVLVKFISASSFCCFQAPLHLTIFETRDLNDSVLSIPRKILFCAFVTDSVMAVDLSLMPKNCRIQVKLKQDAIRLKFLIFNREQK